MWFSDVSNKSYRFSISSAFFFLEVHEWSFPSCLQFTVETNCPHLIYESYIFFVGFYIKLKIISLKWQHLLTNKSLDSQWGQFLYHINSFQYLNVFISHPTPSDQSYYSHSCLRCIFLLVFILSSWVLELASMNLAEQIVKFSGIWGSWFLNIIIIKN